MTCSEASKLPWQALDEFFPRRFLRNGSPANTGGQFQPRQYVLPERGTHVIEGRIAGQAAASPLCRARRLRWLGAAIRSGRTADAHARGASHVLCHCHWQANASQCLTMLLVHGLEGSSHSQYMLGNAARAWAAGCNVVRMNMRNCGGTENLSPTLYHSGLSGDVAAVMRTLAAEKGLDAFALGGLLHGRQPGAEAGGRTGRSTRRDT